jgi:hypothetical protein
VRKFAQRCADEEEAYKGLSLLTGERKRYQIKKPKSLYCADAGGPKKEAEGTRRVLLLLRAREVAEDHPRR